MQFLFVYNKGVSFWRLCNGFSWNRCNKINYSRTSCGNCRQLYCWLLSDNQIIGCRCRKQFISTQVQSETNQTFIGRDKRWSYRLIMWLNVITFHSVIASSPLRLQLRDPDPWWYHPEYFSGLSFEPAKYFAVFNPRYKISTLFPFSQILLFFHTYLYRHLSIAQRTRKRSQYNTCIA